MATKEELEKALKGMVEAGQYLKEGGALDYLSHAPDGGSKWHQAMKQAKIALGMPLAWHEQDEDEDE